MITTYNGIKAKYETVTPIRGRADDVRPIGQRRRDWELVVKIDHAGDEPSYAAMLYRTNVVEYLPNGNVILRTGGWSTPKTADFMTTYSPFHVSKRANKLWAPANGKYYPIGKDGVEFRKVDGVWQPMEPIVMQQQIVDRDKAKVARGKVKGFMEWYKSFVGLSDGWVMHETCKEVLGFRNEGHASGYTHQYIRDGQMVELLSSDDPEMWLRALCAMAVFHLNGSGGGVEKRLAEKIPYQFEWNGTTRSYAKDFYDVQFLGGTVERYVKRTIDKHGDIRTTREVHPADRPIYNLV
jgi:hypothetical protein